MIYILERPVGTSTEPRAWFAYDEADLARKVAATDTLQPWEIYDRQSVREWLELLADLPPGSRVLGFNYDTGERYLSVPDFLPE